MVTARSPPATGQGDVERRTLPRCALDPDPPAVRSSDGTTTIKGSLGSTPRRVFTIQFFSNPSATDAEGKVLLGELNVRTDRFGKASFNFITTENVAANEAVTATATAFATGDTSVFSAARTVAQGS